MRARCAHCREARNPEERTVRDDAAHRCQSSRRSRPASLGDDAEHIGTRHLHLARSRSIRSRIVGDVRDEAGRAPCAVVFPGHCPLVGDAPKRLNLQFERRSAIASTPSCSSRASRARSVAATRERTLSEPGRRCEVPALANDGPGGAKTERSSIAGCSRRATGTAGRANPAPDSTSARECRRRAMPIEDAAHEGAVHPSSAFRRSLELEPRAYHPVRALVRCAYQTTSGTRWRSKINRNGLRNRDLEARASSAEAPVARRARPQVKMSSSEILGGNDSLRRTGVHQTLVPPLGAVRP